MKEPPPSPISLGRMVSRFGLVLILGWIGAAKFTAEEAEGIRSLVEPSPLFALPLELLGLRTLSAVIGVIELVIAVGLVVGLAHRAVNNISVLMAAATFVVTSSFLFTSVDYKEWLPPSEPSSFLLKDFVLLGASLTLYRTRYSDSHSDVPDDEEVSSTGDGA
ncbi:DUF417 family protein [Mycobacteroides abscessus]|uniref:DUF417 family protein n=1 Tax=Mycobacteroides abscessus TaxID=36809 RepID=UPI0009A720C1|nr:DUF417 family protein [Mycobacteroides abscessus]SKG09857.1 inner membrane protein ykgB [Mycobacteroides abscessus subsp. massiliense]SKG96143.1 inner membrane protein ykgB [Mycobacteroides abscessus subsp. massiliense]SKH76518.1 inner membrane protein ykgB [Mycobacteroides abscessus subsp. massiliense]SKI58058.1 inner membrane protein ykgB [Mycobacteroides abscessus subsp. massiliense]SKI70864.1 inner membrane protein ykgB [Mycobacteroides abscessus subsp. massiliense]